MKILTNFPFPFRQFDLAEEVIASDPGMPEGTRIDILLIPVTDEEKAWTVRTAMAMKVGEAFSYGGRRGNITDPDSFSIRLAPPNTPKCESENPLYFHLKATDPASHRHLLSLRSHIFIRSMPKLVQALGLDTDGKTTALLFQCEK